MRTTIGTFLWRRLKQMGVRYVFGVPGDFNLQLLEQLNDVEGIEFVGDCNELNAAYAADGHARQNGMAALLTTYGVGDLSALCGIAGSFAEHVPVVMISGAPPLYVIRNRLRVHHSMAEGDFDNMMNCVKEFTLTDSRITPSNAPLEIDRALMTCWQERCPVYLQIPSNISYLDIDVPDTPLNRQTAAYDPYQLNTACQEIKNRLQDAIRPLILIDMDAARSMLANPLQQIAEKLNIPYASFRTGKAILDESSELWLGNYPIKGDTEQAQWVHQADFILATAPCYQEGSSMVATEGLPEDKTIYLRGFDISIGQTTYEGINARKLLEALLDDLPGINTSVKRPQRPASKVVDYQPQAALKQDNMWPQIHSYFRSDDIILAENGCANIALSTLPLPSGCHYIAQSIWGSIGFTLPALLGSMLAAPDKRHWLFIGDGSLQMTIQELSTILNRHLNPIIVILNNRGYTIERYILGMKAKYNDITQWDFQKLVQALAPQISLDYHKIETHGQLDTCLQQITSKQATVIELILDPYDAPTELHQFGAACANFDYGPRGPQNRD